MINALEMTQTVLPVQFGRSKVTHAGVKGQDGHTLCGRSGGWQGGYYGDAVEVTCKRCLPIMERAARKANTDEVLAASDARLVAAGVTNPHALNLCTWTYGDSKCEAGPLVDGEYRPAEVKGNGKLCGFHDPYDTDDAGFVETGSTDHGTDVHAFNTCDLSECAECAEILYNLCADKECPACIAYLDARNVKSEESVMNALINECGRCGLRMNGEDAKTHLHFQPVWQLLERGVSVESAIIDLRAPNGESYLKSQRGLSHWFKREEDEETSVTISSLLDLIDRAPGWTLYEMPNGDVVAAWSWLNNGEINSVFYITVETEPYTVDAEIMVKIPGLDDVWVSDGVRTYVITPDYNCIGDIAKMYAVREWGHARTLENVKAVNITYKGLLNQR